MIPKQRQRIETAKNVLFTLFISKGGEDKPIVMVQKIPGHTVVMVHQTALKTFCQYRGDAESKQEGQDAHNGDSTQ